VSLAVGGNLQRLGPLQRGVETKPHVDKDKGGVGDLCLAPDARAQLCVRLQAASALARRSVLVVHTERSQVPAGAGTRRYGLHLCLQEAHALLQLAVPGQLLR